VSHSFLSLRLNGFFLLANFGLPVLLGLFSYWALSKNKPQHSANLVSQNQTIHRPVGEPETLVQPSGQVIAKFVNSSEVETDQIEGEMVSKRMLTLDRFLTDALLAMQQQQPQGRSPTPPPPPSSQKR